MSFSRSVAIACAPVVVVTGILAATSAEAAELRTGTIAGYQAEILDSGSLSAPDLIEVYGPSGKEKITVVCRPFDWSSYGPNTSDFVDHIAQRWCFGS